MIYSDDKHLPDARWLGWCPTLKVDLEWLLTGMDDDESRFNTTVIHYMEELHPGCSCRIIKGVQEALEDDKKTTDLLYPYNSFRQIFALLRFTRLPWEI